MRLRTASGLALASLAFLTAVMVLESPRGHDSRETDGLSPTVLIIDGDAAASSHELASWDCPLTAGPSDQS